jgi:hypothetical protein
MLKFIYGKLVHLAKQVWLLPRTLANAVRERQRQAILDVDEAERLDRIRNPDKYLGK